MSKKYSKSRPLPTNVSVGANSIINNFEKAKILKKERKKLKKAIKVYLSKIK